LSEGLSRWVANAKVTGMRIILLTLLAAAGAFAQKVDVEFDPGGAFRTYHTFHIREGRLNSRNPEWNSELVKKRIAFDIEKELTAKHLYQVDGPADLNIVYTFGAMRRTQPEAFPAGWRGWGTRVVAVPYAEGTLVIDLRDAHTHSMVWRSIARVEKHDPHKVEEKIDDMVHKSIHKYPPKVK